MENIITENTISKPKNKSNKKRNKAVLPFQLGSLKQSFKKKMKAGDKYTEAQIKRFQAHQKKFINERGFTLAVTKHLGMSYVTQMNLGVKAGTIEVVSK